MSRDVRWHVGASVWHKQAICFHIILFLKFLKKIWTASSEESAFEYAQNAQIQIILRMCKVPSGSLLSIITFCSIQQFCWRTIRIW